MRERKREVETVTETKKDGNTQRKTASLSPLASLWRILRLWLTDSLYLQEILIRSYFPSFHEVLKNIELNVCVPPLSSMHPSEPELYVLLNKPAVCATKVGCILSVTSHSVSFYFSLSIFLYPEFYTCF